MIRVSLRNDGADLRTLAGVVDGAAAAAGWSAGDASALNVCLEELVVNVIRHGFGGALRAEDLLAVELESQEGWLLAKVEDNAPPYNPLEHPEPDLDLPPEERPVGGLGVHLVRRLSDSVEYERLPSGNRVTLRRRPAGGSPPAGRDYHLHFDLMRVPGGPWTLRLRGRLDRSTSEILGRRLRELAAEGGRDFRLDLAALRYVSSAGLSLFIQMQTHLRGLGGTLLLERPSGPVMRVLLEAGLDRHLPIQSG